ncbi:MAG: plasma-membrane proton-efflux P-type ATPase [Hyphomicrobiales bacterium]
MPTQIFKADEVKAMSEQKLIELLKADKKSGLSSDEAKSRISSYGKNEIIEKHVPTILKFLKNFWGPIPWMIEVAAVLSAVIGHWPDFIVIVVLLFLNALIDFFQSEKAGKAMAALKKNLATKSKVLRNGKWAEIEASELVPGDIVRIRLGDIIPADVKLLEGEYLQIDQSALTGESLPVTRQKGDIAYSGSIAKKGEMTAIVYGTGLNTYFGNTASLVAKAKTKSHLQGAVVKIGDYLIFLNFILVIIVLILGYARHQNIFQVIEFALVLTVASVPVALPTVLSVTMAVGAFKLSRLKAIVNKLVAVEEMAGMDVLCSDKTGTLTKNELAVSGLFPVGNYKEDDIILFASLASAEHDNDPIDNAFLRSLKDEIKDVFQKWKQSHFTPFDPVIKRTEADVSLDNSPYKVSKGAEQVILDLCVNKKEIEADVNKATQKAAEKGNRTIGVAKTNDKGEWEMVGLAFLSDPPRDDSADTITKANELGVKVKMITGDQTAIAQTMGKELNIGSNIIPATDLHRTGEVEAAHLAIEADGFSEVFPEDKYRIVNLLQHNGHIVGMTGDGVNDAPALKKADAGIAVDGATDAAKSASALVLTLPGLNVIISAIKESRRIFQRMQSYATYRISETIDVLFFSVLAIIIFRDFPVTPIAIILLSVFNDFPIMAISYDNVKYSKKPEVWNMNKISLIGSFLGFTNVIFTFIIFFLGKYVLHMSFPELQTLVFAELSIAGNLTIFLARSRGPLWSLKPGKPLVWSTIISKLIITLICGFGILVTPIGWWVALVWVYACIQMLVTDRMKLIAYKIYERKPKFNRANPFKIH